MKLTYIIRSLVMLCLLSIATVTQVHAAETSFDHDGVVIFEDVQFICGKDAVNYAINLQDQFEQNNLAESGMYNFVLTLTDFEYTNPFKKLSVLVTTATDVIGKLVEPGVFEFSLDSLDTIYLNLFGKVSGKHPLGLYGVELKAIPSAPVPLPAGILLLLSALPFFASRTVFKK